ncbi:Acyl-CoA thioesterase 8 [Cichlidogyrus casuarinus]|uniref:Acyl-CoA thioesterase 8 n=1 Tax=Cichlidogyrus casuarinus TaxID=1844966 RepID=A0ABD2Q4I7_9PLAT
MSEPCSDHLFKCLELIIEDSGDSRTRFTASRGPQLNPHTIYGGELMAQALKSAICTVESDRKPISLHCYFHLSSDANKDNCYEVQKMRDGRSFTHRLVTCHSNSSNSGLAFQLDCSFKKAEKASNSFTPSMPKCPHHSELQTLNNFINTCPDKEKIGSHIKMFTKYVNVLCPFEFKPVDSEQIAGLNITLKGHSQIWIRLLEAKHYTSEQANDMFNKYRECFLAYMSDLFLLTTANITRENLGMVASLNHTMWFYNPENKLTYRDWVLMDIQLQQMDSAIAVVTATMWLENGTVLATMTQQGLLRSKQLPRNDISYAENISLNASDSTN